MEVDATHRQGRGRRARIVCHRCHEKKIRCDLQRVDATCSNCLDAGTSCEFRPSHKGHHRRKSDRVARLSQNCSGGSASIDPSVSQPPPVAVNGSRYLRALLGHQSRHDGDRTDDEEVMPSLAQASDNFMPGVIRTYLEVYSEICYTWCPIIDVDHSTMTTGYTLLDHSLASIASRISPPSMPGLNSSEEHYERARHLFYNERRQDTLTLIRAALLLSCCDNSRPKAPLEGSFWWLGVAIRLAQDIRLHRAPHNTVNAYNVGLQRRVWWTLFARERIMALCQGRPCTIVESDCNLGLPSATDFPEHRSREARMFVCWVNICRIMGEINKHMRNVRQSGARIPTQEIAISLIAWLQSIPEDLQLPLRGANSIPFSRDVHFLHMPYLTAIAITYLNSRNQDVPEISVAAVLAAGCTTRIIRDLLLRGCSHALPEDSGWYMTIAVIALMHVRQVPSLTSTATTDISLLRTALKQLGGLWSSAKILATGLDKIVEEYQSVTAADRERLDRVNHMDMASAQTPAATFVASAQTLQDLGSNDGVPWAEFFTFTTPQTSPLIEVLLTECRDTYPESWPTLDFDIDFDLSWAELQADQWNFFSNTP